LPADVVARYARTYGTQMDVLIGTADSLRAMGRDYGGGLYAAEVDYLIRHEFARTAEDILWRRTKLGLHLEKKNILALEAAMADHVREWKAAS
jgi:glycerol-3-phosphate dehydrogenase